MLAARRPHHEVASCLDGSSLYLFMSRQYSAALSLLLQFGLTHSLAHMTKQVFEFQLNATDPARIDDPEAAIFEHSTHPLH